MERRGSNNGDFGGLQLTRSLIAKGAIPMVDGGCVAGVGRDDEGTDRRKGMEATEQQSVKQPKRDGGAGLASIAVVQ